MDHAAVCLKIVTLASDFSIRDPQPTGPSG